MTLGHDGATPAQESEADMGVEPLERAVRSTRAVIEGVTPEQLTLPTLCASW